MDGEGFRDITDAVTKRWRQEMKTRSTRSMLVAFALIAFSARCGGSSKGGDDTGTDADVDVDDVSPTDGVDTLDDAEDTLDAANDLTDVADDTLDAADVEVPETVTISGQVWSYSLMMGTTYYTEPVGGVQVTVRGDGITPGDLTATTLDTNCADWWDLGTPFDCGKFTIEDVPAGAEIMLKATAPDAGDPDTLSGIFVAGSGMHQVLVLVDQDLIDAMLATWSKTQNAANGMVVGLLAQDLNPDPIYEMGNPSACPDAPSACTVSDFIGEATVACTSCSEIVYFDSADYTNTDRTNTDPAQSLFFILNVPASDMSTPNTISVTHASIAMDDVDFAVEAGNITYLLLMP